MKQNDFSKRLFDADKTDNEQYEVYRLAMQKLVVNQLPAVIRITLIGVFLVVGLSAIKLLLLAFQTRFVHWDIANIVIALLGVVSATAAYSVLVAAILGRFNQWRNRWFGSIVVVPGFVIVGTLCLLCVRHPDTAIQNWILIVGGGFLVGALIVVGIQFQSRQRLVQRIRELEENFDFEDSTKTGPRKSMVSEN